MTSGSGQGNVVTRRRARVVTSRAARQCGDTAVSGQPPALEVSALSQWNGLPLPLTPLLRAAPALLVSTLSQWHVPTLARERQGRKARLLLQLSRHHFVRPSLARRPFLGLPLDTTYLFLWPGAEELFALSVCAGIFCEHNIREQPPPYETDSGGVRSPECAVSSHASRPDPGFGSQPGASAVL